MKMRFLPDKPIVDEHNEDALGFGNFVQVLQDSIYNTEPPFVYGVLGDWGTGKTSVMHLLKRRLENDLAEGKSQYVPIWFNAWKYENESNIVYPLLYAIKRDYDRRLIQTGKAVEIPKIFSQVVASSALALTDIGLRIATKHLTGEALKLEDIKKQVEAIKENAGSLEMVLESWANEVRLLDEAFLELMNIYARDLTNPGSVIAANKSQVKFVIFIDDLDRCLPDTAINMLESIKNYLLVSNCVFILGVNPKIIYKGIRIKYKGLEVNGQEYLEKIINYSFYVPEPDSKLIAEFATNQLTSLMDKNTNEGKFSQLFQEFGQILASCEFNNPRKVKRILNRYLFFLSKYESSFEAFYNPNIVRFLILAEFFPLIFQLFVKDASAAKGELIHIGNSEFDLLEFEGKHGISLADVYPQLSRMRSLFELELSFDNIKADLTNEARAVFSITRLF